MASDDLRARIRRACAEADGFAFDSLEPHDYQGHADAVMALVQPELDRLTAELHRHAACALCGHERHRHGYEPIIRRDWCSDCPTTNDLHTFQAKEPQS